MRSKMFIAMAVIVIIAAGAFLYVQVFQYRITVINPTLAEEIVYVISNDNIVNAGVVFNSRAETDEHVAIIWVHGWGVNFYSPTYVSIGRAMTERGYTCISVNTRMHDLGNVEGYSPFGDRLRGGGYWGVAADQSRDISAWIDFVESNGFRKIILAGHSAGCAAVRNYLAESQDDRIVGLVLASGGVDPDSPVDSVQYAQAVLLMSEKKGEELIKDPKRSFPSYISAATLTDIAGTPAELKDFFGLRSGNPGVSKIQCPILSFYGTRGDVGNEKELEVLERAVKKHSVKPISVTTTMIDGADHMYLGAEVRVAEVVATWANEILKSTTK